MAETPAASATRILALASLSPLPLPPLAGGGEEEVDEEGLEELERQVKEMGERVRRFRATMPGLFNEAVESLLVSSRPQIPRVVWEGGSEGGDGTNLGKAHAQQNKKMQFGEEDPKIVEKIQLLKTKVAHNVTMIPVVYKRVNECLLAFEKLEGYDLNVHPSFKRRRA